VTVLSFAGQFFCGNKCCDEKEGLKSWEVNFGYTEHGEKRNALVKLSKLCSVEMQLISSQFTLNLELKNVCTIYNLIKKNVFLKVFFFLVVSPNLK